MSESKTNQCDYTLPLLPPLARAWLNETQTRLVLNYAGECAEAARAPLLARIAELEAQLAQAQSDAKRYRWLIEQPFQTWKRIGWNTWDDAPCVFPWREKDIDEAMNKGMNSDRESGDA